MLPIEILTKNFVLKKGIIVSKEVKISITIFIFLCYNDNIIK